MMCFIGSLIISSVTESSQISTAYIFNQFTLSLTITKKTILQRVMKCFMRITLETSVTPPLQHFASDSRIARLPFALCSTRFSALVRVRRFELPIHFRQRFLRPFCMPIPAHSHIYSARPFIEITCSPLSRFYQTS